MCDGLMDFTETDPAPVFVEAQGAGALFDDDVPPAGTACDGCKGLGHWCSAKCYRGIDTPLCRACADGVDCSVTEARMRRQVEVDYMPAMEPESSAASAVRDVTPLDPAKRVVKAEPMEVWRNGDGRALGVGSISDKQLAAEREEEAAERRARYQKPTAVIASRLEPEVDVEVEEEKAMGKPFQVVTTEEVKEAIRAANPAESAKNVATRLGIAVHLVYYWRDRLKAQAKLPAPKAAAPVKSQASAIQRSAPTGVPIDMEDVGPRVVALGSPLPPTIEGGAVSVQSGRIDAWFAKLPLDRKAELFFAEVGL